MEFNKEVLDILEEIKSNPLPEMTRNFAMTKALEFYNQKKFFEAHEIWEFQWKKESGDIKIFIQALIQISVSMNKLFVKPNKIGALSLIEKAIQKLEQLIVSKTIPEKVKYKLKLLLLSSNEIRDKIQSEKLEINPPNLAIDWEEIN